MGIYTQEQLQAFGFRKLGASVRLSDKASIYNPGNIEIGDHSRIDDFCVLSAGAGAGGIVIGRHVHIAVYTSLIGAGRIAVEDFANLSSRVGIYSSNDDYSGRTMTNPTVPAEFTGASSGPVTVGRHVIIGSGSIVLPNVTLETGAGVGALSLVKRNCEAFGMYCGVPAKRVGNRSRDLLDREAAFLGSLRSSGKN